MAYEFFFSYTRANNDLYLRSFFEDLCEEVRLKRGLAAGAEVGFFDQRSLELGEDWDQTIVDALQSSRVMLSLASPAYFNSDYCGKEWALFRRRCQAAVQPGGKVPPLLKSVVWIEHVIATLPKEVQTTQLTFGDPQAEHNTRGVRFLMKTAGRGDPAYAQLVDKLAREIVDAAAAHPIAPLAAVPKLAEVPSAFGAVAAPAGAAPAAPAVPIIVANPGPRQVNFIYVAANPAEFGGVRPADAYVDTGGGDWRPFFPADMRRVHPLMQNIASDPSLDFSSVEVPFGPDLIARVDDAWQKRQIVVIVVDAWTLHWDAQRAQPLYRDLLESLDRRFDYHWCVLVPWNEQDPQTQAQGDQIRDAVRGTFDRHAQLMPNPMFFRDGIRSVDEFRAAVAEVLTRLKEEIRRAAKVVRSLPQGPARPLVSGPAG